MATARLKWSVIVLLGVGLATAGQGLAADETPPPPSRPPAQNAATAEDTDRPAQKGSPPPVPARPAVKPPSRPQTKARTRKDFRPSEEIHVDKAVDFPADI